MTLWNWPAPDERVAQACATLLAACVVLLVAKIIHDFSAGDD